MRLVARMGGVLLAMSLAIGAAQANTPGIVIDLDHNHPVLFDPDTRTVKGPIVLPQPFFIAGGCEITGDGSLAFVTDFSYKVTAIDLTATPPVLAPPPNQIPISNAGWNLALSPDNRFLVVCDAGRNVETISVVDVATRTEVATYHAGDCASVDVCADGSVLVADSSRNRVWRLELGSDGTLTDTREMLSVGFPEHVACAPDSRSGLVASGGYPGMLTSFMIRGMSAVDARPLLSRTKSLTVSPLGDAVYVRFDHYPVDGVWGFAYDMSPAHFGANPFVSFDVQPVWVFFDTHLMTFDATGRSLYVLETASFTEFDAATGEVLHQFLDPSISSPYDVCLHVQDQDHDALNDSLERIRGTDPADPDSDDDGMTDGYEAQRGFDPLSPLDAVADADGDGLNNLGEMNARSNPFDPDSDDDSLSDGQEIMTHHTDPGDTDTDEDGLGDGAEVLAHGTNPLDPDTDGGGVLDGSELNRDSTDPLDAADDRPSTPGIMVEFRGPAAVVFDPETSAIQARLPLGEQGARGSCAMAPDGRTGFVNDGSPRLWSVDLASTPPSLTPAANPAAIPHVPRDMAVSANGSFVVTCGEGPAVVVLDAATRAVVTTWDLTGSCTTMDVCADGSLLYRDDVSGSADVIRRLVLDGDGHLTDSGESLPAPTGLSVHCAPGGELAVLLSSAPPYSPEGLIQSFRLDGMTLLDARDLPLYATSLAWQPNGSSARAFLTLIGSPASVEVWDLDLETGALISAPVPTFPVGDGFVSESDMHGIAMHRSGLELFLPVSAFQTDLAAVVHDTRTGALLRKVHGNDRNNYMFGLCLPPSADRDGDGLNDDEEYRLGTDPGSADTDGDGLGDRFEIRGHLDPNAPDAHDDPDGDGLDNLAEQAAGTKPRNPDTDGDGALDGDDNCPATANADQADGDFDARGDSCDSCPSDPDPCGSPPEAVIGGAGSFECQSTAGALVTLDGSLSSDVDSTPGTHDDIVLFEWFEDFGQPGQRSLGTGETLAVALPLGAHVVTLRVTDSEGASDRAQATFTVVDTTPPVITVGLAPAVMWPPFHQMMPVTATVVATDVCGTTQVTLVSVTSSEPDDAPGGGDGQTVGDIDGAVTNTLDFEFLLRAERASSGTGRTYTATYLAMDAEGNTTSAAGEAVVPHDRGGRVDELVLQARQSPAGLVLEWGPIPGALHYNVIRGDLARVRELGAHIDLGPVVCLASESTAASAVGAEDPEIPPPGEAFCYLVEFNDGADSTFGSDTAVKPRLPGAGGCH